MGTNQFTESVFTNGGAWNFYVWMPLVGAFAAGLLFVIFFWIRYGAMAGTRSRKAKGKWELEAREPEDDHMVNPANIESSAYLQHASGASLQTRAEDLSSPYHKMK
jgi:hypothetical protein